MLQHNVLKRLVYTILTATALVTLVGCATPSLTQISAFGTASASLADHSKKAYALVDSSTVDRKMYDVASDTKLGPTDSTFQGVFTGPQADALAIRLKLLGKLGDYADALNKLATADFRKDIDAASKDLDAALVGLSQTYKTVSGKASPISDQDFQLIAAAVDAIGTAIVEHKRREAIRMVILQADAAVQDTSKLLKEELGESSSLASFVHENLVYTGNALRLTYNKQRLAAETTFNSRYQMLVQIRQLDEASEASPGFFKNVSAGAGKVGEAHAVLKKAVTKNEFTSAEIAKNIGELVDYAKSVKAFYDSLATTDKK